MNETKRIRYKEYKCIYPNCNEGLKTKYNCISHIWDIHLKESTGDKRPFKTLDEQSKRIAQAQTLKYLGFIKDAEAQRKRKPYDCPALKTPLKMNRNKILKSRKQPEFAEGIYDRYDEMNIQKLIITGMSREDAMNLLDVAGGKIENAMLKLSRSKTDLFTSYDTF